MYILLLALWSVAATTTAYGISAYSVALLWYGLPAMPISGGLQQLPSGKSNYQSFIVFIDSIQCQVHKIVDHSAELESLAWLGFVLKSSVKHFIHCPVIKDDSIM